MHTTHCATGMVLGGAVGVQLGCRNPLIGTGPACPGNWYPQSRPPLERPQAARADLCAAPQGTETRESIRAEKQGNFYTLVSNSPQTIPTCAITRGGSIYPSRSGSILVSAIADAERTRKAGPKGSLKPRQPPVRSPALIGSSSPVHRPHYSSWITCDESAIEDGCVTAARPIGVVWALSLR